MHKKLKFAIILVCINAFLIFMMLIFLEIRYENIHFQQQTEMGKQVSPYYYWSFYSSNGVPIGAHYGPLKLMAFPFVVYKNMSNQKEGTFSTNSLGFRGQEINKNALDRKRVILIGGSSAFGQGLKGNEETIAYQLGQILNAEVINAGVIGYGSGNELVYLLTELVDLKPDLVVTFDGWNDYSQIGSSKRRQFIGSNGQEQIDAHLELLAQFTETSFLKRLTSIKYILFPSIVDRLNTVFKKIKNNGTEADVDNVASVYANNIIKIRKISNSFKFNFICVIQPQKITPGMKPTVDEYLGFRNKVKKHFTQENVKYIDLSDDGFKNDFTANRFLDRMHLTALGNRRAAEIIAQKIIAENLL